MTKHQKLQSGCSLLSTCHLALRIGSQGTGVPRSSVPRGRGQEGDSG